MHRLWQFRKWIISVTVLALVVLLGGTALAAEFSGGDVYRLPAGETVNDDLYVSGGEIYIDGTVEGDLYASGGYIEINGLVTGDVVAAGAGINIAGTVGDDVRVAGAGIDISGQIGDDLLVAGGGNPGGFQFPINLQNRSVEQGVRLHSTADVGGDAMVVGGIGTIGGRIAGDLRSFMGTITLDAQVGGNAELGSTNLEIRPTTQVAGRLEYSSPEELPQAPPNARWIPQVVENESVQTGLGVMGILGWFLRTGAMILGLILLGWLILRLAPQLLTQPVDALDQRLGETLLWGVLAFVLLMAVPLASAILIFLVTLFFGWVPGLVTFVALFGVLGLIWIFSPLVTGLWIGGKITASLASLSGNLPALGVGVTLLVLLVRVGGLVTCVGWLVGLASFILALGGLAQAMRPTPVQQI